MKTLADFKRALKTHKAWKCTHTINGVVRNPEPRFVEKVQGNSVAFKRSQDQEVKYCNGGRTPGDCVWLDYPKASQITEIGENFIVICNYDEIIDRYLSPTDNETTPVHQSHYIKYERVA